MVVVPDTLLELDGPGMLGKWTARRARHVLTTLPRGTFWRDQDGIAHFAALPGEKYALTVSAGDIRPPAFAGLWPGQALTVACAPRLPLTLPAGTDSGTFARDVAPDSPSCFAHDGRDHPVLSVSGRTVTVAAHPDGPVQVQARMVLMMMVRAWSLGLEEWDGRYPWSLSLEEV